jgi:hypothetical protein
MIICYKEYVMARYIDGFSSKADLNDVFNDLFNQAKEVTDTVEDLIKSNPGPGNVRGDHSDIKLATSYGFGRNKNGTYNTTVDIGAWVGLGRPTYLLGTTVCKLESEEVLGPTRVFAYRGRERFEDYDLRLPIFGSKDIVVTLGKLGIQYVRGANVGTEPIGKSTYELKTKVIDLQSEEHERLSVVSQGIIDGIKTVRMIRDGQDPRDVARILNRPLMFGCCTTEELQEIVL